MYPKKISLFIHGIESGTFTRISVALIRGFKEMGINNCDLVVLNATEEEKKLHPDINIISLDVKHATYSLLPLIRYIREASPDVIFPMPWYFNVIAIWASRLARKGTKVVMCEQNIISLEASIEHRDKLRLRYLPLIMRHSYSFGHGVIGVAQDVLTDLIQQIKVSPQIPMTVIPNTVDVERVQHLAKEPINHPWFGDHDIPVVLTAARLAKQKKLDVLIQAFAQIVKTTPARLLILGQGPLRPELESLCKELNIDDCVSMPGYVSNPYGFMAACDVFVLASAWEGSPVALGEALACGAAVVVNDAPGGSKDMVGYGDYGLVVPSGNVEALSSSISKLLTNFELKEHYRQKARLRAQDFEYSKISQMYLDFYQSILTLDLDKQKTHKIAS